MCKQHENIDIILEQHPKAWNLPSTADKLKESTVCSTDELKCAERKCDFCGTKSLPVHVFRGTYRYDVVINYMCYQCEKQDGYYIKKLYTAEVAEALKGLEHKLQPFSFHCYNTRQQHKSLAHLKSNRFFK